jgi:hypothetical protein
MCHGRVGVTPGHVIAGFSIQHSAFSFQLSAFIIPHFFSPTCQVQSHRLSDGQLSAGPVFWLIRTREHVGLARRDAPPLNDYRSGGGCDFQSRQESTAFQAVVVQGISL